MPELQTSTVWSFCGNSNSIQPWQLSSSSFLEQPDLRPLTKNLYLNQSDFSVFWTTENSIVGLTVPKGFISDGASIPRYLWSLLGAARDGLHRAAALVHDYLYYYSGRVTLHGLPFFSFYTPANHVSLSRLECDRLFLFLLDRFGLGFSRHLFYRGVRLGGSKPFNQSRFMTTEQIKQIQRTVGTEPDGIWGSDSIAKTQAYLRRLMPSPNPWPKSDQASLRAFYGNPGDERNLVKMQVPREVKVKYIGQEIGRPGQEDDVIYCHKKVADSLSRILLSIGKVHPEILLLYYGCYNNRSVRGGSTPSLHAYGAAIDFDAANNLNHSHWPLHSSMTIAVMECFAREGWLPAGAFWHRDAMHFQATR